MGPIYVTHMGGMDVDALRDLTSSILSCQVV